MRPPNNKHFGAYAFVVVTLVAYGIQMAMHKASELLKKKEQEEEEICVLCKK